MVIKYNLLNSFKGLIGNVILTGGTTMFPGLSSRVEKDLRDIYAREKLNGDKSKIKMHIYVHDPPRRKHGVFIGGSFLASMTN